MNTRKAGEAAKAGYYFNTRTWEIELHRKSGDTLHGEAGDRHLRIPTAALFVLAPVMGFFFVIFLPFIGFALVARELVHKVAGWAGRLAAAARRAKTAER